MKCPHCNQEHPEGTKFCPETGKKLMLSCRNSKCINYGEYVIPSNYKFCPECGESLSCPHCGKNTCDCDIEEAHHNREIVTQERHNGQENRTESIRHGCSTVSDFRRGIIWLDSACLGQTTLKEMLTVENPIYNRDDEILDVEFCLPACNWVHILYLNPDSGVQDYNRVKSEYLDSFVNPSDANLAFLENKHRVINYIGTSFDDFHCLEEMGLDHSLYFDDEQNDRPDYEIEMLVDDILTFNNWDKIDNFLLSGEIFGYGGSDLLATYRYSSKDKAGNSLFMMVFGDSEGLFGGWESCDVVFAINLLK